MMKTEFRRLIAARLRLCNVYRLIMATRIRLYTVCQLMAVKLRLCIARLLMTERSLPRLLSASVSLLCAVLLLTGCSGLQDSGPLNVPHQTVILYGNDNEQDLAILRGRLSEGIGKENFRLTDHEDHLELEIADSVFGNSEQLYVYLEMFLTEPLCYSLTESSPDAEFIDYTLLTPDWKDFQDIAFGILPGNSTLTEEEDDRFIDLPPELTAQQDVYYMRITFPESIASLLRERAAAGMEINLCNNTLAPDTYSTNQISHEKWQLLPDEDPCTFQIRYTMVDPLQGNEDLLKYDLMHERLSAPYNYVLVDDISWLEPDPSVAAGKNQVGFDNISEDYYVLQYSSEQALSPDDSLKTLRMLSARLDTLDTAYALGTTDRNTFCIKIGSAAVNEDILSAIVTNTGPVVMVWDYTTAVSSSFRFSLMDHDSSGSIRVVPDAEAQDYLDRHLSGSVKAGGNNIYLQIGDLPVIYTDISSAVSTDISSAIDMEKTSSPDKEGNTDIDSEKNSSPDAAGNADIGSEKSSDINADELIFDQPCFSDTKGIAEYSEQILSLLNEIYLHPDLPAYLHRDYICFNGTDYNDASHFGFAESWVYDTSDLEARLKSQYPDLTVSADGQLLNIHMNLETDSEFVDRIFTLVPEIYEKTDFESSIFRDLRIYPCEPEGDERSWMSFQKISEWDTGKASIVFSGSFYNGRFREYGDEFRAYIEKDTFFSTFRDSIPASSYFYGKDDWALQ